MNTSLNIAIAAEFELCEKLVEALEQSTVSVDQLSIIEIYPFSEEQSIRFNHKAVAQIDPDKTDWSAFDYLFFAGKVEQASHILKAAEAGCVVIDMKGVCATLSDVPVVVPSVNETELIELRQRNIVALPDPQVSQLALLINPLLQQQTPTHLTISSLMPASYLDTENVNKLAGQTAQLLNGIPLEEQQRLAFDVFPIMQPHLLDQIEKIFPQLENVVFHTLQVPVFYGVGQMITALFDQEMDSSCILADWQANELIKYHTEMLPTPVTNGEQESQQAIPHLHIHLLSAVENSTTHRLQCWCVADEQRFTLAWLTVKLAERVIAQGF